MIAIILYLIIMLFVLAVMIRNMEWFPFGQGWMILAWGTGAIIGLALILLLLRLIRLKRQNKELIESIQKQTILAREQKDDEHMQYLKQQAELMMLQNQINPHFLYNTLEAIRGEMIIAKQYDIAKMTEILGKFFRYNISHHGIMVSLQEELDNAERYILLEKYRFEERIQYQVTIRDQLESALHSIQVPKLILQPIIENAINHGIESKVEGGKIEVEIFRTDRRLYIRISDNGIGMDDETLIDLKDQLRIHSADKNVGGIALYNINLRIATLWGDQYGVDVYSTKNVGTDVILTMPIDINRENKE